MKRFSTFIALIVNCIIAVAQTAIIQLAKSYADDGDYLVAVRLMKQVAQQEKDIEFYIDDIATIAHYYTHTNELDSAIWYNKNLQDLASRLVDVNDSIAEEYYQSSAWNFYNLGEYEQAVSATEVVLSLRERIYGKASEEYFEWLGCMAYKAFEARDLIRLSEYCGVTASLSEQIYGFNSSQYRDNISSIRGYAQQLVCDIPQFTTGWILPYYEQLIDNDILPQFQYEYELLLLDGFLAMENLQSANKYAHKLENWTYDNKNDSKNDIVPLEDRVRISLNLANYYLHMGDHYKSRFKVEEAWKLLSDAHADPSLAQLMDRHIVERQLRMDTLGRSRINAEWIIETASPIINTGAEDSEALAFFYDSRAWAYEGLNNYDNAISDMQNAIRLNPLYSRKKKLAQFYLAIKDYELAEKLFLEIYNDPQTPEVVIRSIESDLTSLYWLWGKLEELRKYLEIDFSNMKTEVQNAFAFMNDVERENYLENSLLGSTITFDTYTSYSEGNEQWPDGNKMAYNLALVQKGLLLSTTKDIDAIIQNAPDSIQKINTEYKQLQELIGSPVFKESSTLREKRIELMQYVSSQPQFLAQLNYTWGDVKKRLGEHEAAIEFINLWGVTPENIDTDSCQWNALPNSPQPSKGALILRRDSDYPIFVRLSNDCLIDELSKDEDGKEMLDGFYYGESKIKIYEAFWKPLEKYLSGIETIYYSPTGELQKLNFDWLGDNENDMLCDHYNMYRVSSTREITSNINLPCLDKAILYGDILYSLNETQISDIPESRYRSITRSSFAPLYGTAVELDSIKQQMSFHNISAELFTQQLATEKSFRDLSSKSPCILHVATHAFYYTREALELEWSKGNFMAFQSPNPELYHSGLALSGAQDTWINDYDGNEVNFDKYFEMDASSDGILLSSEIAELDLKGTDLVVLSACETALGKIATDGVYGLQRAFKLAGVNSIIMSLWKVDDDATQILMNAFYTNYLNGMTKMESLRNAQLTVKKTPGYDKPYYWASFILLDGLN